MINNIYYFSILRAIAIKLGKWPPARRGLSGIATFDTQDRNLGENPNHHAMREAEALLLFDMLRQYYWLDDALNANLVRLFKTKITRAQSLVLVQLAMGINRPSVIAANVGMSRQSMTQLLNGMKEANLIEMEVDPDDRRAVIVQYCEKSEDLRFAAYEILQFVERELESRIGKRSVVRLRSILHMDWGEKPVFISEKQGKPLKIRSSNNDN